ncbi:hypothetical protein RHMOL_Rhmol13G0245100 [Rhododendron molle]|uniref:Uncharacterized protein n=1 Tax=Rhododendron molle TaxID=49168 RepID=A0ACC0LBC7_RHOML|nr:hypothetical protein RHMOL_Rhmol13G0245100 [Rhododendron molle]
MFLFIPILLISSLVILSQVSVVEGASTEHQTEKLIIGVPGNASFKNFVKITSSSQNPNEKKNYTGFCIQVFKEVWKRLDYPVLYEFVEFNGGYDDLVANVANKTFSAAVGDITILAERWKDVEFTEPFTESGLAMVVPVKPSPKAWIFLEPFTLAMWLAAAAVLVYTMFIVWDYLRHQSSQVADMNADNESVSIKTVRVARYLMNAEIGSPWRSPSSDRAVPETEMC